MGLFKNNFNTPGPGIPKDLPPKKGLALFFDILIREFWNLVKLNLIFLLFCIPLVTIGPAYAAMTKVTTKMVWDQNVFVFDDFWTAFKKNIKRSFPIGIAVTILTIGLFYGTWFYLIQMKIQSIFTIPFLLSIVLIIILALAHVYLYPLLVLIDLKMKDVVRNSFLLGMGCIRESLPCALICTAAIFASYWYFPVSLPLALLCLFSLVSFINSFAAWKGIKKYVIQEDQQENQIENI